jgi:hypothetical protein
VGGRGEGGGWQPRVLRPEPRAQVDLSWAAGDGDAEVKGTARLVDAGPDDLDDLELSDVKAAEGGGGGSGGGAGAVQAAKGLAAPLRRALGAFYQELKQR